LGPFELAQSIEELVR